MAVAPATALRFDRVTKRYRNGTVALRDVSWSIAVGARACLLGPNGSGKTTSIRILEGALTATAGRASLLDRDAKGPGYAEVRLRTGIVPQNAGMYADLTAGEYLELVRRLYGRGDVARAVEQFDLAEHTKKRMSQLSGGFQRRLLLAAALLSEPDLLLLDEPTVGLDPVAAHEVHELLRTAMAGRTTLLCTHNLAEAESLCDDVVILRGGTVLLHEPLATLRARQRPRTRIAARQPAQSVATAIRRLGFEVAVDTDGVVVETDARRGGPRILRALLDQGFEVYESRPLEPTLKELFLEAVEA